MTSGASLAPMQERRLHHRCIMHHMETLSSAMTRLEREGYDDQFLVDDGALVARRSGRRYRPQQLKVRRELRFEGPSNPGDESILVALESEDGAVRGTFCAAYGPNATEADAEVLAALVQPDRTS